MPKSSAKPEIYLLILMGFKPQEIIAMGFSKGSVYSYNAEFPKILERLRTTISKSPTIPNQAKHT
jgi:hypothetical protein